MRLPSLSRNSASWLMSRRTSPTRNWRGGLSRSTIVCSPVGSGSRMTAGRCSSRCSRASRPIGRLRNYWLRSIRASFLLNDLTSQFTRFELAEFTALKSSYSKECYRRLKQYRQTGVWKVSIDEFRRLLDVPESYQARDLNKRVLKPIQDELGPLLNLVAHKKFQKKGSGRGGRSLVGFEFEFDPEKVPGGVSAPRVELSPGVVADAARKSSETPPGPTRGPRRSGGARRT